MYKNPSKIIQNLRIMDLKILYKMIKVSILLKSTTLMIKNSSFNPKIFVILVIFRYSYKYMYQNMFFFQLLLWLFLFEKNIYIYNL